MANKYLIYLFAILFLGCTENGKEDSIFILPDAKSSSYYGGFVETPAGENLIISYSHDCKCLDTLKNDSTIFLLVLTEHRKILKLFFFKNLRSDLVPLFKL